MKNFILKKNPMEVLNEGFYLTQSLVGKDCSLNFSLTPVHFCFFTYDTLPNQKDIVKQNIDLLKAEIKDKVHITTNIFSCYWRLIPLDNNKTKCYIYVKSEDKSVNSYLYNLGILKMDTLERESV